MYIHSSVVEHVSDKKGKIVAATPGAQCVVRLPRVQLAIPKQAQTGPQSTHLTFVTRGYNLAILLLYISSQRCCLPMQCA